MMDLLEFLTKKVDEELAVEGRTPRSYYRKDLLKALIMSYPEGTPISDKEIALTLRYDPGNSALHTRKVRMVNDGEFKQYRRGDGIYSYKILIPPKEYIEERKLMEAEERSKPMQTNKEEKITTGEVETMYTFEELEALAMKATFYGVYSIKEFLKWLKEQENVRD